MRNPKAFVLIFVLAGAVAAFLLVLFTTILPAMKGSSQWTYLDIYCRAEYIQQNQTELMSGCESWARETFPQTAATVTQCWDESPDDAEGFYQCVRDHDIYPPGVSDQ